MQQKQLPSSWGTCSCPFPFPSPFLTPSLIQLLLPSIVVGIIKPFYDMQSKAKAKAKQEVNL